MALFHSELGFYEDRCGKTPVFYVIENEADITPIFSNIIFVINT